MKTLFLVRHAKPDSYDPSVADIDRPLIDAGIHEARIIAEHLLKSKVETNLVISSPALRAKSTAEIFSNAGLFDMKAIQLRSSLYESSAKEYLDMIHQQDDSFSTLMIFGHNPSISELLSSLSIGRELELGTCHVAILIFQVDSWQEIEYRTGKNSGILTPAALKSSMH